jgi:septum formation protein
VLTADTTVALDGRIFGKPADADEAAHMLQALSGRQHQVLTAVAVAGGDDVRTALSESTVEFRELTEDEIRRYIATREPLDKAGAYAIQGRGALFVRNLNGSYSGVMGLPLFETAELLRAFRVAVP